GLPGPVCSHRFRVAASGREAGPRRTSVRSRHDEGWLPGACLAAFPASLLCAESHCNAAKEGTAGEEGPLRIFPLPPPHLRDQRLRFRRGRAEGGGAGAAAASEGGDDRQDGVEASGACERHEQPAGAAGDKAVCVASVEIVAEIERRDPDAPLAE